MEQEGFNAKAAAVFKHITPRLCDNGARHSRLCERCHISPVICSQIWKWSGALRVTVLLQIRLQGNAVFITLREGEIRWCLAVALPASSDLIKVKTRPSGKKKKKGCLKKVSALRRSRRFLLSHLDVGSSLVQASCLCDSPRCFVPLRVSLFSRTAPDSYFSLLSCSDDVRAGSSGFLLLLLMPLHGIEASLINQLPQGQQQNIFTYGASFGLLVPSLYNLLSNYFYLIWLCWPSSSLSHLVRSAGLPPAAPIDWNIFGCLFDETLRSKASRLNLGKCSVEEWKLFFFAQCCFFSFRTKMLKHPFTCKSQQQHGSNGTTWMHTWHNTLMEESSLKYSEALRETSAGRDVLCISGSV